MNKNILILSAGRRVELVKCFCNAAKALQIKSKIITADNSDLAPALYFSDKFYLVPRIDSGEYITKIVEICNIEDISLIIPTIDTELKILSENKQYIENNTKAKVLVSDIEVINICRDKTNTQQFFEKNSFGVPKEYKNSIEVNNFPVFIKPIDGSSSINTFKVNNKEELAFFENYIKNPIIQEYIEGKEFTVDVFCDFNCNPITIVPRERIAVRNGEILKGRIIKDRDIIEDVKRLIERLKPIGQITIQCMKTANGIKYIEINPRFGGGAPMSIKSGADSCKNIYKILMNEKLEYNEEYEENLYFLRFDDSIILNEKKEKINV